MPPNDSNPVPIVPIPAVNGAILNQEGEILITRRSSAIREGGKWCLPGGHLDGGEDWVTAVRRELNEEIGIEVVEQQLLGIYSDPSLTVTEKTLDSGHRGQFLVATFLITKFEGDIKPNFEVDKWGWFPADRLPEPMIRSHPVRIHDALNFVGQVFVR